jgi:signal transduction histidine kinase/CHASE2 domain-containing sensor protein
VGVAALVVALWAANWFVDLRLALTNIYYVDTPTRGDIVLIGIDDATLADYGALLDWPRSHYADLLTELADAGARVVAFDILFAEPNDGDDALAVAINDARTAGTRTVLAASGQGQVQVDNLRLAYPDAIQPQPPLTATGAQVGVVNATPDADGTVRRGVAFALLDGALHPSFPVATYLAYYNVSAALTERVVTLDPAAHTVALPPDLTIPTDENGYWMHNMYGDAMQDGTFPVYSFTEVLAGDVPTTAFNDKIIMVGLMNVVGAVDRYPVPITRAGEMFAGVEIQANMVETLLQGRPLREEPRISQVTAIVVLALVVGVTGAYQRWYWKLTTAAVLFVGWWALASVMFSTAQIVLNPLHPMLTLVLTLLAGIGGEISLEVRERRQAESALRSLVQVSAQRLNMERIMPLIAADVRRLSRARSGGVWTGESPDTLRAYGGWGDETIPFDLLAAACTSGETRTTETALAVPVRWRDTSLAVFGVVLPRRDVRRVRAALERFALRLAPNLENARLYIQTERQKNVLSGVLADSPAGTLVLDDNLTLLRGNARIATWFNVTLDDYIGKRLDALTLAQDAAVWEPIHAALDAGESFSQNVKLNGRTFQLDAAHITDDERWIITLSDISDIAELNQLKTRMIRMASHDLKNPLGRIIGYGELMTDPTMGTEMDERSRTFVQRIVLSANEMNGIIHDILDLEHIRSGKLERQPIKMALLARDVIQRHTSDMSDREQTFTTEIPDDLPDVLGDYNQLVQSVSNLLGNASKYTPSGGDITLRLYAQNGHVRLEVQDNGYGMPKEAQENLFTEFYRVRTEKTRNIKGTGLGLSLVKSVIEAHGGKIWVESELDAGSTFFVDLPASSSSD